MKQSIFITAVFILLGINIAQARIKIPIGEEQKLEKVADLPDTEDYLISDGHYVDLGQMYSVYTIAWVPVWVTQEPQLVLFDNKNPNEYYSFDDEELKTNILKENDVKEDDLLSVGFFGRIGGKLIFLVIIAIIIYGAIPSKK